ncbi:MAG: MarR family transcriptional regulator [Promethearchaeota archaeon]
MEIIGKQLEEFKDIEIDKILENKEIFSSLRLFKCILGLNHTESKILGYMMKNKDVATAELAKFLDMDRSSVQRALQNLSDLKIIKRKSISMKQYVEYKKLNDSNKKGYVYVYNAEDMELIKKELKKLLKKWYESMLNYVENLDTLCECCGIKFENC